MLGYLPALGELYGPVLIPEAVAEELERLPGAPGSGAPALDPGEREAIAVALGMGAAAAVDDRRGVPTVGTLALLVELHRMGHARRGIEEDLGRLREAGMYLTDALRRRVLEILEQSTKEGEAP